MDNPVPFIIFGMIVISVVFFFVSRHLEKKRAEAFEKIAAEMGLAYHRQMDEVRYALASFVIMQRGRRQQVKNCIVGDTEDTAIQIFDYSYVTGSGKQQSRHQQSMIAISSSTLHVPHLTLAPETLMHRIGSKLGMQDIDFDEYPDFSKQYVLTGANETAIRSFFDESLAQFFSEKHPLHLEAAEQQMIYYRPSRRVKPEEVREFFEEGFRIFSALAARCSEWPGSAPPEDSQTEV